MKQYDAGYRSIYGTSYGVVAMTNVRPDLRIWLGRAIRLNWGALWSAVKRV